MNKYLEKKIVFKVAVAAFLIFLLGYYLSDKIDLVTTDLGRHLKNGELIFEGGNFKEILGTNFYSYTEPNFPFVNHHWGSGVVFFLVQKTLGFSGLSFLYVFLAVLSFGVLFLNFSGKGNFWMTAIIGFFLLPLIGERHEIRPEIWSLFLGVIFFLVMERYSLGKAKTKWLILLPILMLFWVNLHVYFILGLAFIFFFFLENVWRGRIEDDFSKAKIILGLGVVSSLATFLNPLGWKTALYPFRIFENYGYKVLENQSVWFVRDYGLLNPNYDLAILVFFLSVSLGLFNIWKSREKYLAMNLIGIFMAIWGILAIRNFAFMGIFALPVLILGAKNIFWKEGKVRSYDALAISGIIIFLVSCYFNFSFLKARGSEKGWGLRVGETQATDFFRDNNLRGPIFNNYDIGGYLIYTLPEKEKVFVDNRPEAYSADFFEKTYVPMQESEEVWQRELHKFGFRTIFFSATDITPWAQKFLKERLNDSEWKMVYRDQYAIIFTRR